MHKKGTSISWEHSSLNAEADTVVLIIHGMNCSALTISGLVKKVQKKLPTSELLVPSIPLKWASFVDLAEISQSIAHHLSATIQGRPIQSLIISGHSAGGALAQSVCLDLQKEDIDLDNISMRLVLIAPMTRGWEINHHLPLLDKLMWVLGLQVSKLLRILERGRAFLFRRKRRPMWILQLQRGSQFLVGMRLQWLEAREKGEASFIQSLETYVILGSVDEIISWRDMVDEVISGENVRYLQVPYSNHAEIIQVDPLPGSKPAEEQRCRDRAEWICGAMAGEDVEAMEPWDNPPHPANRMVERVVFVIHGIRDEGHWTQKIAARARKYFVPSTEGGQIAVETSSYGFFSMLEFLNPVARQKKIHWLMDEYVEARRRYPNPDCKFSFIGHSNGTYLLAQALKDYPEVKFERVAFAGSVVTSQFEWNLLIPDQVQHVLNFTGRKDWVVSLFPRAAEIFPPLSLIVGKNLGGAGVLSFEKCKAVTTKGFLDGGHGVAIQEENWDNLAKFAVSKNDPPTEPDFGEPLPEKAQWWYRRIVGKVTTPLTLLAIVAVVYGLGWLAWSNPLLFWLVPVGLGLIGLCVASIFTSRADGVSFEKRRSIQKMAVITFIVSLIMVALWLLTPLLIQASMLVVCWVTGKPCDCAPAVIDWWRNGFADLLKNYSREILGAFRMASLGVFGVGLYKVLTRV